LSGKDGYGISVASRGTYEGHSYSSIQSPYYSPKGYYLIFYSLLPLFIFLHIFSLWMFKWMQTFRVNLKALELAKKIQWDFYTSSSLVYELTADEMKVKLLTCNDVSTLV
jgi:hypothetical protein